MRAVYKSFLTKKLIGKKMKLIITIYPKKT